MKMTLLEIVQNILSSMDGEEVSSISDTIESMQVAEEVKTSYFEILGNVDIKSRKRLIKLEALSSPTSYPNVLKVEDEVDHFEWIKYNVGTNVAPVWKEITYLDPTVFFDRVSSTTDGTLQLVETIDSDSPYYIRDDADPTCWTTYDNKYITFDSYNSDIDSSLQNSKSLMFAEVIPTFTMADNFTPDLEEKLFSMLLAEAKSAAFVNYKGVSNSKEEQRSRRQLVRSQNNRGRYNKKTAQTNFGRS